MENMTHKQIQFSNNSIDYFSGCLFIYYKKLVFKQFFYLYFVLVVQTKISTLFMQNIWNKYDPTVNFFG